MIHFTGGQSKTDTSYFSATSNWNVVDAQALDWSVTSDTW